MFIYTVQWFNWNSLFIVTSKTLPKMFFNCWQFKSRWYCTENLSLSYHLATDMVPKWNGLDVTLGVGTWADWDTLCIDILLWATCWCYYRLPSYKWKWRRKWMWKPWEWRWMQWHKWWWRRWNSRVLWSPEISFIIDSDMPIIFFISLVCFYKFWVAMSICLFNIRHTFWRWRIRMCITFNTVFTTLLHRVFVKPSGNK